MTESLVVYCIFHVPGCLWFLFAALLRSVHFEYKPGPGFFYTSPDKTILNEAIELE